MDAEAAAVAAGDGDPEHRRGRHRHLHADARCCRAIRRPISPALPRARRRSPRSAPSSASTRRCPSSSSPISAICCTAISATRSAPASRCVAEIATRLPASAELTLFALILAVAIAIPLGVLAAVKQGTWIDHLCRIVTTAGVSLPVFFTGLLFAYVFYYLLQWAPAPTGRLDVFLSPPTDITGFYLIDSAADRQSRDASGARCASSRCRRSRWRSSPWRRSRA